MELPCFLILILNQDIENLIENIIFRHVIHPVKFRVGDKEPFDLFPLQVKNYTLGLIIFLFKGNYMDPVISNPEILNRRIVLFKLYPLFKKFKELLEIRVGFKTLECFLFVLL